MASEIKQQFDKGVYKTIELVKCIYPELSDRDANLIKVELRSMVANIVAGIGNNTNSLINELD